MPGPCCHLVSRIFLMILNGAAGVMVVASLMMTFYRNDATYWPTAEAHLDNKTIKDLNEYYSLFKCYSVQDGYVFPFNCNSNLYKPAGAFLIIAVIGCAINFVLSAILLGIQNKWNHGHECCVNHERGFGIAVLITSFIHFISCVIGMAIVVKSVGDLNKTFKAVKGMSFRSESNNTILFGDYGGQAGEIVLIVAFVVSLICLLLAAVPCLLGLQYCGCWGAGCGADESEEDTDDTEDQEDDERPPTMNGKRGAATGIYTGSGSQKGGSSSQMSATERRQEALRRHRHQRDDAESVSSEESA